MAFYDQKMRDAVKNYIESSNYHQRRVHKAQELSRQLFELRMEECSRVLVSAQSFGNLLTNTPEFFTTGLAKLEASVITFIQQALELNAALETASRSSTAGDGIIAGVNAGAGMAVVVSEVLPRATVELVRKYCSASTGTAINTLYGAAAKSATLARIGGGAITAGGGGMAKGAAILWLANPIGLAVGIVVGGILKELVDNKSKTDEADELFEKVAAAVKPLEETIDHIIYLIDKTKDNISGADSVLSELQANAPSDYLEYSDSQKKMLEDYNKHIKTLALLMKRRIK